jgi:hypothetical protein
VIRLQLPSKPVELTAELEQQLTAEFISNTEIAVWNKPFIKTPLHRMTEEKCAYCEQKLGEGVNFTLDHYVHKFHAPDRVVEWGNLLPSCQSCNSSKGTYDVLVDPFFNPSQVDPKNHIEISPGGFFKGITVQGKAVVLRLKLNESNQKAPPRFRLIQKIHTLITECEDYCEQLDQNNNVQVRTRLRNKVGALLNLAQRKSEFSATASTILLNDSDFEKVMEKLKQLNEWNDTLEALHLEAQGIAMRLRLPVR